MTNDSKQFVFGVFIRFSSCGQTAYRTTFFLTVFGCQNVIGYASALTTT